MCLCLGNPSFLPPLFSPTFCEFLKSRNKTGNSSGHLKTSFIFCCYCCSLLRLKYYMKQLVVLILALQNADIYTKCEIYTKPFN